MAKKGMKRPSQDNKHQIEFKKKKTRTPHVDEVNDVGPHKTN